VVASRKREKYGNLTSFVLINTLGVGGCQLANSKRVLIQMNIQERKLDYNKYLLGGEWKVKRTEAFRLFGKSCQKCKATLRLHVHHKTYIRFKNEVVSTDLAILCTKCHNKYHKLYTYTSIETTDEFILRQDYIYKSVPKKNLTSEQRIERYKEKQRIKKEKREARKKIKEKYKYVPSKERTKKVEELKKLLANRKIDKQEYFEALRKLPSYPLHFYQTGIELTNKHC
jgi:hypothetical protein